VILLSPDHNSAERKWGDSIGLRKAIRLKPLPYKAFSSYLGVPSRCGIGWYRLSGRIE